MAMTLIERHIEAQDSDYLHRLAQAMTQHAVYLMFNAASTAEQKKQAAVILAAPAHHARRMAYWILNHSSTAEIESVDDLTDDDLLEAVQTIWTTYAQATAFAGGGAP